MTFATHLERQFMQRLRGAGWVKASALPPSPRPTGAITKVKSSAAGKACNGLPRENRNNIGRASLMANNQMMEPSMAQTAREIFIVGLRNAHARRPRPAS
jgi:hypothetical protein